MGPRFRGGDELGNMHSNDRLSSWEIVEQIQRICPTAKSLLIFRNRVKPLLQKYFASLRVLFSFAREAAGALSARHSLRPLNSEGGTF